jgi:hypothetical protein
MSYHTIGRDKNGVIWYCQLARDGNERSERPDLSKAPRIEAPCLGKTVNATITEILWPYSI